MNFFLSNSKHEFLIFTDDYSEEEIEKKLHIANLRDDIKNIPFKGPYYLYDKSFNLIGTFH